MARRMVVEPSNRLDSILAHAKRNTVEDPTELPTGKGASIDQGERRSAFGPERERSQRCDDLLGLYLRFGNIVE